VAVAVAAHAVHGMAKKLAPDLKRQAIVLFALIGTLVWQTAFTQVGVILIAALGVSLIYVKHTEREAGEARYPLPKTTASFCLLLCCALLFLLPVIEEVTGSYWVAVFDSFYRSGSLVFGGGHVVLPLLEQELVPNGWVTGEEFLAGYGATQAVPGPLF